MEHYAAGYGDHNQNSKTYCGVVYIESEAMIHKACGAIRTGFKRYDLDYVRCE